MAKTIMIQGTMSNAGKSLLAAGLCRVLKQDGYRVAPFKSQNMALNSFITKDGGEMGRAQVVQAEAAGIEPDVRMNPILLKPTTDVGSQVIVNGRVQGNLPAMEYYRRKRDLIPAVMEAYESLAREYDIIVIEGAGSPAEINLQENDIVNMGLARMVDAPVLLVGDIDRGGVFAQLYGTVALQSEEDRRRIKGVVVNKFRGDRAILEPGLKTLEELCGVPVAGVVPYLHVDIDDEDSLSERFGRDKEPRLIDIAAIRLPRISPHGIRRRGADSARLARRKNSARKKGKRQAVGFRLRDTQIRAVARRGGVVSVRAERSLRLLARASLPYPAQVPHRNLERLRQRPAGAEGGSSPQSGRRKKRAENRLRVRVRQPKYLLSGVQKRIRTPSPARRRNKRRINRCKKTRQFSTQRYCKSAGNPSCGLL